MVMYSLMVMSNDDLHVLDREGDLGILYSIFKYIKTALFGHTFSHAHQWPSGKALHL